MRRVREGRDEGLAKGKQENASPKVSFCPVRLQRHPAFKSCKPTVVVGGVLLAGNQLLGVEELAVGAGANLVDDGGLQVDKHGTGHVLARAGLGEESVERVVATTDGLVGGHLTVRL